MFNSTGIHPMWAAHQVVVTPIERIFLDTCLLDDISPTNDEEEAQVQVQVQAQAQTQVHQAHHVHRQQGQGPPVPQPPPPPPLPVLSKSPGHLIRKEELLTALSNLKCTQPAKLPRGDRNLITPEELMEQYTRIRNKTIMLDSIKNMPVECEGI